MKLKRYHFEQIQNDLAEKMVFLGGPRQVGKTYLAKSFIQKEEQYLIWDQLSDKKRSLIIKLILH